MIDVKPSPFHPELTTISRERLIPLLQRVEKPGRYTGGEFGIPKKEPSAMRAGIVLCYPDLYEIGMSNQGLKILYDSVNRREDLFADRVFLPWIDFGVILKEDGIPLYSLDHYLALTSFDTIGINVSHELAFTNLLHLLDLAAIPIRHSERRGSDPFIIAGGTAVSNPLPIADFVDGVFIGDGEEGIIEILETIARGKESGKTRQEILADLRSVEGLFLSALYHYDESGNGGYEGPPVKKRTFGFKEFAGIEIMPIPNIALVQDRAVVEVARGCGQGCRFCHAGFWKRPVRNRQVDALIENAERVLKKTGSDSLSLHSLSIADYPFLPELVTGLARRFGPEGISLSLPSLRVQAKTIPVIELTSKIRKSGVTFAIEAGSELARERIRKKSSEENLHYLIGEIYRRGWDLVKVYFMLGLPDPDGTEVDDLIRSLNALSDLAKRSGAKTQVNITVSLFVPKPFTTFQWERQADPEYFYNSIARIKGEARLNRVHLKYPHPYMAYIEGLLSRADARMGRYIELAYRRGAVFDSWDDRFRRDIWEGILAEIPVDMKTLWLEKRECGARMPWSGIIDGFPEGRLVRDYHKYEEITPENMNPPPKQTIDDMGYPEGYFEPVVMPDHKFTTKFYLEIEYEKRWPLIYIGHLDLNDVWRRVLRRAGVPMSFSFGFNKHEKMHFTEPLPIFFFSASEILHVELYDRINEMTTTEDIKRELPPGLLLKSLRILPYLPDIYNDAFQYEIEFASDSQAEEAISKLADAPDSISFEKASRKKKHRRESDVRIVQRRLKSAMRELIRNGGNVQFELEHPNSGAIGITDLLTVYLGYPPETWNVELSVRRLGFKKKAVV
jgi:radical SAM family uncharacterized protein/radical SAM-linked protein